MLTYEEKYINGIIELSLITLPADVHIQILKQIVENKIKNPKIINLYKRFNILIMNTFNVPIGYIDNISVNVYSGSEWQNEPFEKYNIGRRYDENKYLIGYVINENSETKLKLREPIIGHKYSDLRSVHKGMVCENNVREDLISMITDLRKINTVKNYAYLYDQSISKGSNLELCTIIKLYLLSFEEKSRNGPNGMKNSIRWVYLFHDILPNLMIK